MKNDRYTLIAAVIILYLFPILLLCAFSLNTMGTAAGWNFFSMGIVVSIVGSSIFLFLLYHWEKRLAERENQFKEKIAQKERLASEMRDSKTQSDEEGQILTDRAEWEAKLNQLISELQLSNDSLQKLQQEQQQITAQKESIHLELDQYRHAAQEQIRQRDNRLLESQQVVAEQRDKMEKLNHQIDALQSSESDLKYELKTLLKVAKLDHASSNASYPSYSNTTAYKDIPNPPYPLHESNQNEQILDPTAARLKRYVDMAAKMTGSTRMRELPIENHALEMRRLCDTLRTENNFLLLLYSLKDHRLLFVNNQARDLLDWSVEKMTQSFSEIVVAEEWQTALDQLSPSYDAAPIKLHLKSKNGNDLLFQARLGVIHNGIFRQHLIGLLSIC